MSFEIYSEDFSNRHEISHAISVTTLVKYNGIGKITIVVPLDSYNASIIKENCLVLDKSDWETFIIVSIKIDTQNNQLTANGYTSNWILNKRIVLQPKKIENIESGVYDLVNENIRGFPNLVTDELKPITDQTSITVEKCQLLDGIISLLATVEMGNRIKWDHKNKRYIFEVYKGEDLTSGIHSVVFSHERGTAKKLVISRDASTFKNVFYMSGVLSDGTTLNLEIGDAVGSERYEKFIDEVMQQESEESRDDFLVRWQGRAEEIVADYLKIQNFTIEADSSDYGTQYKLGDIISCVSTTYGVKFKTRITEVQKTYGVSGNTISLVLGKPDITIIEEMRLNG